MAYKKQNFVDGQILTADHLNHMEEGISNAGGGSGGGGVSSWNDLPDKPFYVKEEGWEINFDPETQTELPYVEWAEGAILVRVSEMTPSNEELKKCTVTAVLYNPDNHDEKSSQTVALSTLWERLEQEGLITDGFASLQLGVVVRDLEAAAEYTGGNLFTQTGTYFAFHQAENMYMSRLTKPYDVQTLDPMFLPDTLVGRPGDGVGAEMFNMYGDNMQIASGDYSHVEGVVNAALGEAAHAEGGRNNALGGASHVEGGYNTSGGNYSHAEGYETEAAGFAAHTEGTGTFAFGEGDHAEGAGTFAIGSPAHAEGQSTLAMGDGAHAEGYGSGYEILLQGAGPTYNIVGGASGFGKEIIGGYAIYTYDNNTSATYGTVTAVSDEKATGGYPKTITIEGGLNRDFTDDPEYVTVYMSYAIGHGTHIEGECTIAASNNQHVQGRFNAIDTEYKYAHIVGNGKGANKLFGEEQVRSNAHTLDWDGNGWYAGTVEATGIILKSSTPGSTKRFLLTVDDNGQPNVVEITE